MKLKNVLKVILIILCILLTITGISLYQSKYSLTVSYYALDTELDNTVRIVQISDLHNSVFGDNNQKLIETVKEQNPDIVLMTGDILNRDEEDYSIAVDVTKELVKISPVYFSYGNHEVSYEQTFGINLRELFTEAGAIVLDQEYEDIVVNDELIRIGGVYGYCLPEKYLITGEARENECNYLNEFQDTYAYTILMCHMPAAWLVNNSLNEWDVDCVFSGHAHGGQIIIPFIGGLFGQDIGWFPGRLSGVFTSDDGNKNLVLSRGLGSSQRVPRLNNIPEIVVVDLK